MLQPRTFVVTVWANDPLEAPDVEACMLAGNQANRYPGFEVSVSDGVWVGFVSNDPDMELGEPNVYATLEAANADNAQYTVSRVIVQETTHKEML